MAGINHVAVKASGDKGLASEWNADHEQKGNHDCAKFQHLNHVIENRTTFPGGPVEGQVIFRTDEHKFYVWNGTTWITFIAPATIVVAADGSGHYTDIQDGIDALPVAGGAVYIKEGTYTITVAITIPSNNISLIGAGKATKITTSSNINIIFADMKSGILIENIYLYGAGVGNAANNGIRFSVLNDSVIKNCWIENCGGNGIRYSSDNRGILIFGNWCVSNALIGIKGAAYNSIIKGNFCSNNSKQGIEVSAGFYNIIDGNVSMKNTWDGILINDSAHNSITNNTCSNNDFADSATYDGIRLVSADGNVITGNRCHDNDRYEINISNAACDDNLVMGNNCKGADHVGAINDAGTNTLPNGVGGTNALSLDDHNIIA